MRAPRYRFPEVVRSTTRTMASRMVRDGTIARTPEELDAWIAGAPEVREPLEKGGYGTAFSSADLLPLLDALVVQAGGPAREPDVPPPSASRTVPVAGLLLAIGVMILLLLLAVGAGAFR